MKTVIKACVGLHAIGSKYNPNYTIALALDPSSGVLTDTSLFTPDFLIRNPMLFKAKKGNDPDHPRMVEALSGQHRDEFLQAMLNEITELEHHGTWEVVKKADIPMETLPDGTQRSPQILSGTWAFRIKRFPSGLLRKIKARFCARGDQQQDVDVFDTYVPVASWSSI